MSQKTLTNSRLQLILATDEKGSTKSMSFSRIRLDATTDQYYNRGGRAGRSLRQCAPRRAAGGNK